MSTSDILAIVISGRASSELAPRVNHPFNILSGVEIIHTVGVRTERSLLAQPVVHLAHGPLQDFEPAWTHFARPADSSLGICFKIVDRVGHPVAPIKVSSVGSR
jgi:hypothetical protein